MFQLYTPWKRWETFRFFYVGIEMEHLAKMGYFEKEKRWSQEDFTIIKSYVNRLAQDK